jgi:nitrite reductase/ring-hydroxylating ferredoxin subunit
MPAPHEEAVLLEAYLHAMRGPPARREPPAIPSLPARPLPPLDAELKRRLRVASLAANDRYVQAFLEEHSICPFSRGGRLQGQTARHVHFAESADASPIVEQMAEAAAQPGKVVVQLIFPLLDIGADDFRQFCHDVTSAGNARIGPVETYAVAPLHPDLAYLPRNAYTIIPLFRRAPDPTIQWVRLDALESIYEGRSDKDIYVSPSEIQAYLARPKRKPLFDMIAETNLKMAHRLGIENVEKTLRGIARDARHIYERILLGEDLTEATQHDAAGPALRRFEHREPVPPARVEGDRIALASLRDLPLRKPLRFLAEGVELVAIRRKDDVAVLYGRCPHRAAPLDAAVVEEEHLVCPYHGWDFRIADGQSNGVPGERIHRFHAEIEGGLVWLTVEELHRIREQNREVFTEKDVVL